MNTVIGILTRLYVLVLRLYPRRFRLAFDQEMQDVYQAALVDASSQGTARLLRVSLREWSTLAPNLLREHWCSIQKGEAYPDTPRQGVAPLPWPAVLAATSVFLIAGLELVAREIPYGWPLLGWLSPLRTGLFFALLMLPAIGSGIGWTRGFPRWSYPYVMLMVMFGLYMMSMSTLGLWSFTDAAGHAEFAGWPVWLPGLSMMAIALLVSRSLQPAMRLFANVWEDWTLLTWGMFGAMPLFIAIGLEEVDQFHSLPLILFLTSVMAGTSVTYLRSQHLWQQCLALLTGTTVVVTVVAIAPTLYRSGLSWHEMLPMAIGTAVVVAALFSPAFIGLLRLSLVSLRSPLARWQ